jgi:uncharacterized membrane protein (DUF4010 family)
LLGGSASLAVAAYVVASQQTGDRDGTTEAAALLVLATGSLSGLGYGSIAAGVAAVAVLALAEKSRIREFITRIGETELRAALHFIVLAVVVLPLLPTGPFGPRDAIRPRELWSVVLIFSGLNFLGYLARRAVGADRGYGIAGLLGGLVSSTAVTLGFSRQSRLTPEYGRGLAPAEHLWGSGGVLGSAAVLGLTDMDALTYSMSRFGVATGDTPLAARAIAIGLLSNTVLKLGLALTLGAPKFRRSAATGLLAFAVSLLAGLLIWS